MAALTAQRPASDVARPRSRWALRARRATPALAALLLVAACGATNAAPTTAPAQGNGSGPSAADLCALVTQAEMGTALGNGVSAGVPSGVNAPSCSWQPAAGSGVGATIAATSPDSVGQIPYGLQNMPSPHVTSVPGVGDTAFFASAATGTTAELDIRKGSRAITITVGSTDPNYTQAQQEAAELAIGTAAAKRL